MSGRSDFKVVLLGGFAAGKTSLLIRLTKSKFDGAYENTICGVFHTHEVTSKGKTFRMGIWDTCGQERFRAVVRMYYRDANAAVVCYDVSDAGSWPSMKRHVDELREINPDCKVYICGTKKDIVVFDPSKRQIDQATVSFYAKGIQSKWFETSSKTGENVSEVFQCIADDFSDIFMPREKSKSVVDIAQSCQKKSKCAC